MPGPTPAVTALMRGGIDHELHRYEHDPDVESYGLEAAEALEVEPERIFKTLVTAIDGKLVVGVVPVTGELDLKALAAAMDAKHAVMADPAMAERATGYVLGGISPVGQKRRLPTVIDASASKWETVFVSGGRRGLEIEVAPDALVDATGARLAAIAKSR